MQRYVIRTLALLFLVGISVISTVGQALAQPATGVQHCIRYLTTDGSGAGSRPLWSEPNAAWLCEGSTDSQTPPQAVACYAQQLAAIGDPGAAVVACRQARGLAASSSAQAHAALMAQAATAPVRQPAPPPTPADAGTGSKVAVAIANGTAAAIGVVAVDPADQQTLLGYLDAGRASSVEIVPGHRLAFSQDGQWLGQAHPVTPTPGQSVTVPIAAAAPQGSQAPQGPVVQVTNTQAVEIVVIAVALDGTQTGLLRIAPGATAAVPAQPGLSLGFAQGQNWIGDVYPVSGQRGEAVTVPYAAPRAPEPAVPAEVQRVTGPGSREVTIVSRHSAAIDILHIDRASRQSHILGSAAPGGRSQVRALPGTALYVVETGRVEPVIRVVTVSDQPAQTFEVAQSPVQARNYGPGGGEVTFRNAAPHAIAVAMSDGAGGAEPIVTVPAAASASARLLAPAELFFYNLANPAEPGARSTLAPGQRELALPVAIAAVPIAQWDAGGVSVSFVNGTQQPISLAKVAIDGDGKASSTGLGIIAPGATLPGRLNAGTLVAAFDATSNAVIGGYYRVPAQANQSVRLPYDPAGPALARARNSPNFVDLLVEPGQPPLEAFILDESGVGEAKFSDLQPGMVSRVKLAPGTELRLRERGTGALIGEPIMPRGAPAGAAPEVFEVPFSSEARTTGLSDPPTGASGAPVALKVTNKLNEWVKLVVASQVTGPNGQKQEVSLPLGSVAPLGARVFQVKPLHRIFALQLPTLASVSQPYSVVPVPSPEFVVADEERGQVVGADAVAVNVSNTSAQAAFVYGRSDLGVPVLLGEVPPRGGAVVRANALELIWFVVKPGPEPFQPNREYQPLGQKLPFAVARMSGQKVTLPYEPSDADVQRLAGCDLDKLAKEVVANLQKSGMDAREQAKLANACWKNTSTRGAGTFPTNCKPGEQERAGLCYTPCRPGYNDFVTICVPQCPPGFREDGLYCYKPGPVERSAYHWNFGDGLNLDGAMRRCRAAHGPGCTKILESIYSACPANHKTAPVVVSLCTPVCPAGMTDIGISCQKNTYDRGVGRLKQCPPGKTMDAGLCYPSCPPGSNGVGPVCWNQCPRSLPIECGAICARDQNACTQRVVDQVTSPLMATAGIVLTAVTFGAGSAATVTARTAAATAQIAVKVAARQAAKEAAKRAFSANMRILMRQGGKEAARIGGKVLLKETASDLAFGLAITGAIEGLTRVPWRGVNAARDDIKVAVEKKVRERLSRDVSDAKIAALTDAAFKAAEDAKPDAEFPWTALDPTGIADIAMAYNMPMCADVR